MHGALYPFWFWNGLMEENELARQLDMFANSNCDGVVVHCRAGNRIEYLSERWFELFTFTVREAKKRQLKIWIYDEADYPSGNAGGRVQKLRPDLVMQYMRFEYGKSDPVAPATCSFEPGSCRMVDERRIPAGTPVLRFFQSLYPRHVDTFNREAAEVFCELTHEQYRKYAGEFFGDTIEAIYTDDQAYIMFTAKGLAWSPELEKAFARHYGQPLRELLPLLVEDLPGCQEARNRYRKCAESLFLENYIAVQRDWCHKHGIFFTGHLCGDEGPLSIMVNNFGSPFGFFYCEDIPGIDDFVCDRTDQRYLNHRIATKDDRYLDFTDIEVSPLMIYKYASAVARQFKEGLISCECLTFLGWERNVGFFDRQMRFEIGMGVNLFTPHAFYYTTSGVAKRDCPGSYFFQQPGFDCFGELFRTWKHAAELLCNGTFKADALLFYPDGLGRFQRGNNVVQTFVPEYIDDSPSIEEIEKELSLATLTLMRRHVGFEYGAEEFLNAYGEVADGKIRLGKASYSTLILPEAVGPRENTRKLIDEFVQAGGRVISSSQISTLEPDLSLHGEGTEEILLHARDVEFGRIFYLMNLSGRDLTPFIELPGKFILYDPTTGKGICCQDKLPEGMVLPAGISCFLLPESFTYMETTLEESLFAPVSAIEKILPVNVRLLHNNLAVIDGDCFVVEPGAKVKFLLSEDPPQLDISGITFGQQRESHPADSSLRRIELNDISSGKIYHVAGAAEKVILEGDFLVIANTPITIAAPRPVPAGNLANAGYPNFWGKIEYTGTFYGAARFFLANSDNVCEVWLNGHRMGESFAENTRISFNDRCNSAQNELKVILSNTPGNLFAATPFPFGIETLDIIR